MAYPIESMAKAVKTTEKRCFALLLCFALAASYLCFTIFRMQVSGYDTYQQKVIDQITTSSVMKAKRGCIYDSAMNLLATTKTVWRVFLSPVDIKEASEDDKTDYAALIADGLSDILSLPRDSVYQKAKQSKTIDVTLKKTVEENVYKEVTTFVLKHHLENMVHTEATYTRYYPMREFAAQTIGFTGADNQGLFGLEYYYDSVLSGSDGYYVYAKDAQGNEMPSGYINYIEPQNGNSLVTTIDKYMQQQLEYKIREIEETFAVQNRVTGIVMNVKTGAILAMATTSAYDLNAPYELDSLYQSKLDASGYEVGTDAYKKYKTELLYTMWQNKPVCDTYEPGSTFKIVTVAAGLETGAVSLTNHYNCTGSYPIGGYNISCHKRGGHGHLSLSEALQQSCNPAMIQISASTGVEDFYRFVEAFGYLEKTGIDLPSEGKPIFHKKEAIGTTELATASFGQRFKITPLQQITAIAAVANGGYLVTPYVVEHILGSEGNITYTHTPNIKRQVISSQTAATVAQMLEEGVSGDGGAKNAAVAGYKIAAKTGTSEKFDILDENGNSFLRIGSCVGFAPSDNAEIAILIVVDEPTTAKYGSMVAAPYIGDLMEVYLPYLGHESQNVTDANNFTVGAYVGTSVKDTIALLKKAGVSVETVGDGDKVYAQMPVAGTVIDATVGRVILYTEKGEEQQFVTVPNFTGKTPTEANLLVTNLGLNLKTEGVENCRIGTGAAVVRQSVAPGTRVPKGTRITLTFLYTDSED